MKTEAVDEGAAVHEAIVIGDDEEERGEETKQDDVREAARGMLAMGRTGREEDATFQRSDPVVEFVDGMEYHPRCVGRQLNEQIYAMDRPMDRNPTADSKVHYPAKLVCVFFLEMNHTRHLWIGTVTLIGLRGLELLIGKMSRSKMSWERVREKGNNQIIYVLDLKKRKRESRQGGR